MSTPLYAASPEESQTVPASDADIATARAEIHRRHEDFKNTVRNEILEQFQAGKWCRDGCNRSLRDLDLPELSFTYHGPVTITVDVTVHNADNRGIAETWVRSALTAISSDDDVHVDDIIIDEHGRLAEHSNEDDI